MPSTRPDRTRTRLAEMLIRYRQMAKLTQQQLSDLTYQLAEAYPDTISHGIQRVMIVRAEGRTIPMPDTLNILAHALAHAMRVRGYDTTSGDDLYNHLMKMSRSRVTTRDVSPQAVELDALLAPLRQPERDVIYEGFLASARAQTAALLRLRRAIEEVRRRKAAASAPPPDVPPGDAV